METRWSLLKETFLCGHENVMEQSAEIVRPLLAQSSLVRRVLSEKVGKVAIAVHKENGLAPQGGRPLLVPVNGSRQGYADGTITPAPDRASRLPP